MTSATKKYALMMAYEVSDEEKDAADKALAYFEFLLKSMKQAEEHLDLLYLPFKDDNAITPEQSWKSRAALRRYRDSVVDNFNRFKRIAFKCFALMQPFSSDTQIITLNKSFVLSIADLEKQVNRMIDLFNNLKSKDFGTAIIKAIENIKKELAALKQIVEDRIMDHIQTHILSRNWTDSVSEELQQKIEERVPEAIRMVEERKKEHN